MMGKPCGRSKSAKPALKKIPRFICLRTAGNVLGMNPPNRPIDPHTLNRRDFIRLSSLTGAFVVAQRPCLAGDPGAKFKAAVIGHTGRGDYGHGMESIFSKRPNIDVVALADPDAEGRAKMTAKIDAPRSYADYRELLEKERPDLVSIAMRQSDQHLAIGLAALRAGAHLYCEKPFVTAPNESDELLVEADQRGRKIAVAHTMRMMPVVVLLKRAIAEGLIGEVQELRCYGKQIG